MAIQYVVYPGFTINQTLNVNAAQGAPNTKANAWPVIALPLVSLESRFHDASSVNINNNVGAWVQFGGAAAIANTIYEISMSANIGEPTQFGKGANAGAVTQQCIFNQGEGPSKFGVSLVAGDKIWIRSLSSNSVTSGYLTMNLSG